MEPWSLGKRIAFRLTFSYFANLILVFPLGNIPGLEPLAALYDRAAAGPVQWVGNHILRIPGEIKEVQNGSGDTTFSYVYFFTLALLAAFATLVWSVADARRPHYRKLFGWLRVALRYGLASMLLSYGINKLFKLQFPFPNPMRLLQPYGESSPMGLLWTFMGYSTPYTVFAGAGETLGGLLLLSRRTATFGALVSAAVMTNVVMLNFCYDVPVKLLSSQLLFMSILLLLPEGRRLANLLIFNRPVAPATLEPHFTSSRLHRVGRLLKVVAIGVLLYVPIRESVEGMNKYGDDAPRDPLYGAYEVEEPTSIGWRKVGFDNYGRMLIRRMDDSATRLQCEHDKDKRTLTVSGLEGDEKKYVLSYARPDRDHVTLEGTLGKAAVKVRLRKLPASSFLLVNRGFHWINEVPFNR